MSPPNVVDALVVGGVDFGESDRVVHLLGREGRISGFAPAARKSRRRFGGALEPFTTVRLELGRRRSGDLVTLVSAEVLRARLALSRDLERLALAAYASELGFRLAPEGAPTQLPSLVEDVLDGLMQTPASRVIRRAFELRVLDELGFRPELRAGCLVCGDSAAFLDLERGGLFCGAHRSRGREIGPRTRAWLGAVLDSDALAPTGPLSEGDSDRAARAVGPSIDVALGTWIDRPLGSRRLLEEVGL